MVAIVVIIIIKLSAYSVPRRDSGVSDELTVNFY